MFCLSKTTDYAITALVYLAERPDRVASAREIARERQLPGPLMMNILKRLQTRKLLRSTRGVRGGYSLNVDLNSVSVFDLVRALECDGETHDPHKTCNCGCENCDGFDVQLACDRSSHSGVQALHFKMIAFLKNIRLADLVVPGRCIDVPIDSLRLRGAGRRRSLSLI